MPLRTADELLAALLETHERRMAWARELCVVAENLQRARAAAATAEEDYLRMREGAEVAGWSAADLRHAGLPEPVARSGTEAGDEEAGPATRYEPGLVLLDAEVDIDAKRPRWRAVGPDTL